jgi:hypothetical protein
VLSNLPRTRPQRSTARRTAARKAGASGAAATRSTPSTNGRSAATKAKSAKTPAKSPTKARSRPAAKRASAAPRVEPVPMQGFESESDRARGPVHPPGGAELMSSAAEIVGELAKAGFTTGERLLKDVLSRLPLP